jgi:hypothetical protein
MTGARVHSSSIIQRRRVRQTVAGGDGRAREGRENGAEPSSPRRSSGRSRHRPPLPHRPATEGPGCLPPHRCHGHHIRTPAIRRWRRPSCEWGWRTGRRRKEVAKGRSWCNREKTKATAKARKWRGRAGAGAGGEPELPSPCVIRHRPPLPHRPATGGPGCLPPPPAVTITPFAHLPYHDGGGHRATGGGERPRETSQRPITVQ